MIIKQYYYHSDHLGSATLISDYKGDEYQRIEYTPYGETWVEKTSNTGLEYLPYKFTGKEVDEETGLYYYGARYLDARYSRWLSTDPALSSYMSGSDAGCGGIYNHVNFNLYHYAGNNPVKYTDPDGKKIKAPGNISQYSASEDGKLGKGDLSLRDYSCTLTTFVRMAEVYGYKGGIDNANQVAIDNDLFTNKDELSPENGAKLATLLIGDASIEIQFDKSIFGDANKLAVGLNGKENEASQYFATLRMKTSAKGSKKEYEHSLSIDQNSVFVNDASDIENALGFKYMDTSTANRKDTNDKSRVNNPFRIDFFKIIYKNWAMLENEE